MQRLLAKVDFNPGRDTLWAVGDLIARGPESLQTLKYLYNLESSFNTVLGNHDLHFLAIYNGLKEAKKSDYLDDLLHSPNVKKYAQWLRSKPLAMKVDKKTLLTHAGLYPMWSVDNALHFSEEVHYQLQDKKWLYLLEHMYGSEPTRWDPQLAGIMRSRFIINAFTRMRFITTSLELEFATKLQPEQAPENLIPWFEAKNPNLSKKQTLLFGHWAALMGNTGKDHFIGLDTGYVWGNSMTLYHLESRERVTIEYLKKKS